MREEIGAMRTADGTSHEALAAQLHKAPRLRLLAWRSRALMWRGVSCQRRRGALFDWLCKFEDLVSASLQHGWMAPPSGPARLHENRDGVPVLFHRLRHEI